MMRGVEAVDDFFSLVKLCGLLMEGYMTKEEKHELLCCDYHALIPCRWQQRLLSLPLLSEGGELYRMFWRAGIYDTDEMADIVLRCWYLERRTV